MEPTLPEDSFSHTLHKLLSINRSCGSSSLSRQSDGKLPARQTELKDRSRWEQLFVEKQPVCQMKAQVTAPDPPRYTRYAVWGEGPSLIEPSVEYSHIPRACRDAVEDEYLAGMGVRSPFKNTFHLPGLSEDTEQDINDDASVKTPLTTEGMQSSDVTHIVESTGLLTPPDSPEYEMNLKEAQLYFTALDAVNHPEVARYQYHSQAGPLWDSAVEILVNSFLHPLELTESEFVSLVCSQGNATSVWLSANARAIASRSINKRIESRESLATAGIDCHALSDDFLELYNSLDELDRYHFRKGCRYLQTFVAFYEKNEIDLTTPELCFYQDLDIIGKAKFIAMQNKSIGQQTDTAALESSQMAPKTRDYGQIVNDILADLEVLFIRSDFGTEQQANCPTDMNLASLERQGGYQDFSFDEDAVLHNDSSLVMEDMKSDAQSTSNEGNPQANFQAERSSKQAVDSRSGTDVTDPAATLDNVARGCSGINDAGRGAYHRFILGPTNSLEDYHAVIPQDTITDTIRSPQSHYTAFHKKLDVTEATLDQENKLSLAKSAATEDSACDLSHDAAQLFDDQQNALVALMQDTRWIKIQRKYAEDLIDTYKSDITVRIIDEEFAEVSEIDLDDADRYAHDMKKNGCLRTPGAAKFTRKLLDLTNGTFRSAGLENGVKQAYYQDALQDLQASDGHLEGSFRTVGRYLKGSLLKKTERVRKKVSTLFGAA